MSIDPSRRPIPAPATPFQAPPRPTTLTPAPAASASTAKTESPGEDAKAENKTRQMMVGREIALSGKITGCDMLVVEGTVDATLVDCGAIEIAGPGVFKGEAAVDNAEISGRYEGTLTVRKRLLIRESGLISGTIRYGQLEVECGGRLTGDIGTVEIKH